MNDLDKIYNLTLQEFSKKLKSKGIDELIPLEIINLEIEVLEESYQNQVKQRDSPDFDYNFVIELQKIITKKKEKRMRYIDFFK